MRNLKLFSIIMFLGLILGACDQADVKPQDNNLSITVTSETVTLVEGCNPLNAEGMCQLSTTGYIIKDVLYFDLYSTMGVSDIVKIKRDILKVEKQTDIRDAEIWINSGGGSAFTGLAMSDELLAARERGWNIVTKASGIVASAAVPVFASGNIRIAMPGTIFMVHEPAMFKWPGKETASMIRSQNELMVMLQERYMTYLVYGSDIKLDQWQEMEKKTTWFKADNAKDFGLVTEMVKTGIKQ